MVNKETERDNHSVKIKENEKIDKYLDLAREQKKLWNVQVMVIPIVVGALGTVLKRLEILELLEIGKRIDTVQRKSFFRSFRILRRVLETWGDLLSLQ